MLLLRFCPNIYTAYTGTYIITSFVEEILKLNMSNAREEG